MILTKWNVGLQAEAGKDLDLIYGLFTKEVMLKNKWNLVEEIEIQDINKDVYKYETYVQNSIFTDIEKTCIIFFTSVYFVLKADW